MAVEIRNLTINCDIAPDGRPGNVDDERLAQALRTLRRELAADCERRIAEALRRQRER